MLNKIYQSLNLFVRCHIVYGNYWMLKIELIRFANIIDKLLYIEDEWSMC